ncbi:MAG TPA: DNA polymerase III subunit gamma/tau [Candidatus Babeliales bacterium]|nr:DNA polymerase III subunit gamma/tau [Candidatus Babeliales bacterium]
MSAVVLNLSRKWRSQSFDQVIGQDLAIRILKNSLYLGHYFPVYLFAGQRGCGKTSTARIFAAAVNCYALSLFQKKPKNSSVPCLTCESCSAMREGNHPDFIEVDAASHTGVDNIRSIIESSLLIPLMGHKRVYLIDEAHMLSKAAFNAALKILEEPPATALFILATTNPHKIIDTVRSRCFQVFFMPIEHNSLKAHLQTICKNERIIYTDDALDIIVRHTEGSARDALNLLEQVRFSSSIISKETVLLLLGHIDDQHIINLIICIMCGSAVELVQLLHSLNIDKHKAEFIWQRMVVLLRALLWIKHGVTPHESISSMQMLEENALLYPIGNLHQMIEDLYTHEELFLKTTQQHVFLEIILLNLCYTYKKNKKKTGDDNGSAPLSTIITSHENSSISELDNKKDDVILHHNTNTITHEQKWLNFVAKIVLLNDPLGCSIFKQARLVSYMLDTYSVIIELPKDFILFKEWLDNSQLLWQPLLRECFTSQAVLNVQFTGTQKVEISKKQKNDVYDKKQSAQPSIQEQPYSNNVKRYSMHKASTKIIPADALHMDVSDEDTWKLASTLLCHFPGVITEMRENQ